MSTGTETAATAPKTARRSRARKPAEAIDQAPESAAEPKTAPDPTPEPVQGSPDVALGAISEGLDVESIVPTTETSATGQPEALPSEAPEETKWPRHYVEALQDWEKRVRRAASACKELKAEMNDRKAELNKAKKAYEAAVAYFELEADREPEKFPLFDNQAKAAPAPARTPAKVESPASFERWKAWKLEDIEDLPGGTLEAFERVNLQTLGELTAWIDRRNRLEDLPGIGPAKAEKIADKLAELHLSRPWDAVASAEPVKPEDEIEAEEVEDDDQAEPDDEDIWDDDDDDFDPEDDDE